MDFKCKCGAFHANIEPFPGSSPGRCVCYCDDCQRFARHIGREDLLDAHGGTEIVPVYPKDYRIVSGRDEIRCTRLSPRGLYRWWVRCCNTPIGNVQPGFPWVGLNGPALLLNQPDSVRRGLGPIRSRIQGKFASPQPPPPGTSEKLGLKDVRVVLPFVLKGFLLRKGSPSPFFSADGKTPIVEPEVLSPSGPPKNF